MRSPDPDMRVRLAAFDFLTELVRTHGEVLPPKELRKGFEIDGRRVPLQGPQGIFKPAVLPFLPLSITTAPLHPTRPPPYTDAFSEDGTLLLYRYRGTNPRHSDNVRLRRAMEERRPLVYFHGVVKAEYFAAWPVFVVGDEPEALTFRVAVDDAHYVSSGISSVAEGGEDARRSYITVTTRHRLHQRSFRLRVLRAYRERCALCRLRHEQLLDAAHIRPDSDERSEPSVSNGLALCKLHHAAFDRDFIGIRPDLVIQVREEILAEKDGPMLIHGLQGFHGKPLSVPRHSELQPRRDLLEERYERFLDHS